MDDILKCFSKYININDGQIKINSSTKTKNIYFDIEVPRNTI